LAVVVLPASSREGACLEAREGAFPFPSLGVEASLEGVLGGASLACLVASSCQGEAASYHQREGRACQAFHRAFLVGGACHPEREFALGHRESCLHS